MVYKTRVGNCNRDTALPYWANIREPLSHGIGFPPKQVNPTLLVTTTWWVVSSSQPKRKERKYRVGSEMVLTVLRHSFMGTSPINVAACLFQREIPSLNVVVFLVPLCQRVSPSCSTSFFLLCPFLTLTKSAHVSSYNYTSTLPSPLIPTLTRVTFDCLPSISIFTRNPSFDF